MSILDSMYNYYEQLVMKELAKQTEGHDADEEYLSDVVCVALNGLPARYFRHGVDMAFYLEAEELAAMRKQVSAAVKHAIEHIEKGERQ